MRKILRELKYIISYNTFYKFLYLMPACNHIHIIDNVGRLQIKRVYTRVGKQVSTKTTRD